MKRDLEADIRTSFAVHASGVPADALARLRAVDYRPRVRRLSPRLAVPAIAGVATTGTVVCVIALGGSQAAFADWSATPTSASSSQTSAAATSCQQQLPTQSAPPGAGEPDWSPVVTDVRGPFTLVIYQSGSDYATCLTGPSITVVSQNSANSGSLSVTREGAGSGEGGPQGSSVMVGSGVGSGGIEQLIESHLSSATDGPYTLVDGRIAAGVTGVTLVRNDGQEVEATIGNGWFAAWWPDSQDVTSAEIMTASGVTTQKLTMNAPLLAPPLGSCSANSQTVSSSPSSCSQSDSGETDNGGNGPVAGTTAGASRSGG